MTSIPNIEHVARALDFDDAHVEMHGRHIAKLSLSALTDPPPRGKLILVSAMTPTPAGEGKTTVSIGLAQGLKAIGKRVALALRQPSMGPVFGRKGTATGGGQSSIVPSDALNLHFTGDFHAITTAHNLLSATLDNALHFKTTHLAADKVLWKRVMDMNDRALRRIRVAMDDDPQSGRATAFDITAASEIMAILCLAENYDDLRQRLDRMLIGFTAEMRPFYASDLRVTGALLAVLRDAMKPNLVQSIEGVPTFVHGGPFANIAHGCNSVLATRMALAKADYAVTEAGFAFDLGGEKFIDIKCRQSGLRPDVIVLVATVRALKMHGGVTLAELSQENGDAVVRGLQNLHAHIDAARYFQRPVIVAINRFLHDTPAELKIIEEFCRANNVPYAVANVFAEGGAGGTALAEQVVNAIQPQPPAMPFVYDPQDPVPTKLEKIVKKIYGGDGVTLLPEAQERLQAVEAHGYGDLPICMAKTQESLSDNAAQLGRPQHFKVTVRDFEVASGAGFLVALTGKLLRMPALPKMPLAERLQMDSEGVISGW